MSHPNPRLIPLQNQEQLEALIAKNPPKPHDPITLIKFGAHWCFPCKKIDMNHLLSLSNRITWYECDVDQNDYSPGYCGVKTIPAFMAILNGKPQPLFSNSDTAQIEAWIRRGFTQ